MPATPQPIGFAAASREATFPSPFGDTSRPAFPRAFTVTGSYARASSPLRSLFADPPGRPSSGRPLLLGFLPSSRHHRRRLRPCGHRKGSLAASSRLTGDPTLPLRSVHRFSQPRDGLLRQSDSRAYFIPQPRPGFSVRPGVSPAAPRYPTRRRALPPCRCCASTGRRPDRRERASRLRGFVPCNEAFLRVRG